MKPVVAWLRREGLGSVGLGVVLVLVTAAVAAPWLAPYDPTEIATGPAREGPSGAHWFGTDPIGRDVLSRVLYGARVSLRVGVGATAIAVAIGVVAGAVAGWYGRLLDTLLMRVTDVLIAVPYLVLALAIVAAIGPGEGTITLVLGFMSWMPIARIVRAQVLQEREREYALAARALGLGELRVLGRHVLPSTIPALVVLASLGIGAMILTEATLSFLGVGVQDPTPSWGLMLHQAKGTFGQAPHLLFFPGAAVFLTVIAFVLLGDALRNFVDPRTRRAS